MCGITPKSSARNFPSGQKSNDEALEPFSQYDAAAISVGSWVDGKMLAFFIAVQTQ
jgi:hypothetical protein